MKKYKLLKDLPNLKAGAILTLDDEWYCIDEDNYGEFFHLVQKVVETRPDWFEEVKELKYTEEDMRECFEQSRLTHPMIGFKHDNFEGYLHFIKTGRLLYK